MKTKFVTGILLLLFATPAFAHRLDEYLQAATIGVDTQHLSLHLRLTPGVAVYSKVIARIDTNDDGTISDLEKRDYVEQVRRDLSLSIDSKPLSLRLVSAEFPSVELMKQGLGDIEISFQADLPRGAIERIVTLENHHQNAISVYLVNCLMPRDPGVQVIAQERNYDQSFYRLRFTQGAAASKSAVVSSRNASLFRAFVYQGIHHILTGYDHLLFVSALVLAATTLWDVVKVVFAFTLAHSITLTMAALNWIHVPSSVVEPLISASIVFVALQNVFFPRRAKSWHRLAVAFFFGLFHGLGFAGGLLEAMQEMQGGTMLLAILAFSIGVEIGHQMVVLPLFALLKGVRSAQSDVVSRTNVQMLMQRFGSAAISAAGFYYLCVALRGNA